MLVVAPGIRKRKTLQPVRLRERHGEADEASAERMMHGVVNVGDAVVSRKACGRHGPQDGSDGDVYATGKSGQWPEVAEQMIHDDAVADGEAIRADVGEQARDRREHWCTCGGSIDADYVERVRIFGVMGPGVVAGDDLPDGSGGRRQRHTTGSVSERRRADTDHHGCHCNTN